MTTLPDGFLTTPFAHRGLHGSGCPENSFEAFEAALAAGYGIELDIQGTADGKPVVFHDDTLDRMTHETGSVRDRTLAEMTAMPLKGGGTIVDLDMVIRHVAGKVPILIEIKDQSGTLGPTDGVLEAAVASALRSARNVAVMSFNPASVMQMKALLPDIPRGLVTETFLLNEWPGATPETLAHLTAIADYDASGACFISHDWRHFGSERVEELKSQGAKVLCWTVKSPEDEAVARATAHNITFEGYAAPIPGA